MTRRLLGARYGAEALERLREVVAEAKSEDRMAPVTVLVPDNLAGIVARRHLAGGVDGRGPGIAGVRITTLARLAEEAAALRLAPRRPATPMLLAAAWRTALVAEPGVFAPVAGHTATIEALVRAHRELRDLDEAALDAVAAHNRVTRDLVRLHRVVVGRLSAGWYDETDLLGSAAGLPDLGRVVRGHIVLHLPQVLTRSEQHLVSALERSGDLTVIVGRTGVEAADGEPLASLGERFERLEGFERPVAHGMLSASDSDDEVRCVGRAVLADLAEVPAHRVAVLYAARDPYARLLHERFAAMGIEVNGPGVRPVLERAVPRAVLELLALADGDVPRTDLFRALSHTVVVAFDGNRIPLGQWERVSREAGVVRDGDWDERLERFMGERRADIDKERRSADPQEWRIAQAEDRIRAATALRTFALELRNRLQRIAALTTWRELSATVLELVEAVVLPEGSVARLRPEEQHAAAAVVGALRSLADLEELERTASLSVLRDVLQLELGGLPPRVGTFGTGVLVAPLSAAIGLDLDRVHVVGLAEDLYPGGLTPDALLPEEVREDALGQLASPRRRLGDRRRALLAAMQIAPMVTVSVPRGDLRRSTHRLPSRWLLPTLRDLAGRRDFPMTEWEHQDYRGGVVTSASFAGELLTTPRLADPQEWRTRAVAAGLRLADPALAAARLLVDGRRTERFTRFDGNLQHVDGLPDLLSEGRSISPTALEDYAICPHAYFVKRMLKVQPLEQPEDIITMRALEIGSFLHECLDELTREGDLPQAGASWRAEQRRRLEAIAREKATVYERRGLTGHPRLWAAERERLFNDLERILDDDDRIRQERGASVLASELTFGMEGQPPIEIRVPGGRILLRGSADRVDRGQDGTLYVIDVKSGGDSKFKDIAKAGNRLVNGTKLQLPVYAHAARRAYPSDAVHAEYWFVRKDMKRIALPLAEVEEEYAATLDLLARSMRAGVFPNRPPEKADFSWVQCWYCNPDGIGHGQARERWERKRVDALLAEYVGLVEPGTVTP